MRFTQKQAKVKRRKMMGKMCLCQIPTPLNLSNDYGNLSCLNVQDLAKLQLKNSYRSLVPNYHLKTPQSSARCYTASVILTDLLGFGNLGQILNKIIVQKDDLRKFVSFCWSRKPIELWIVALFLRAKENEQIEQKIRKSVKKPLSKFHKSLCTQVFNSVSGKHIYLNFINRTINFHDVDLIAFLKNCCTKWLMIKNVETYLSWSSSFKCTGYLGDVFFLYLL